MKIRLLAISLTLAAITTAGLAQTTVITTTPAPTPVPAPAPALVVVPAPVPVVIVPAPQPVPPPVVFAPAAPVVVAPLMVCDLCGTVSEVKTEERKGQGGTAGIVGGALLGGLLGNQIGKGDGNKVATVGGAFGGAMLGNEVQKQATAKKVWLSSVKMKDGSVKTVEQDAQPAWAVGDVVKIDGNTVSKP